MTRAVVVVVVVVVDMREWRNVDGKNSTPLRRSTVMAAAADAAIASRARERLIPARDAAARALEEAREDEAQWLELEEKIAQLRSRAIPDDGFDALVDVGGGIHARGRATSASRVFVDVGLGFRAEMTLEEAETRARRGAERARDEGERARRELEEIGRVMGDVVDYLRGASTVGGA